MANLPIGTPKVFTGVESLVFTKYDADGDLMADSYKLMASIEDTTSLSQEDPDVNEIKHEDGSIAYATSTPGSWTFTTDLSNLNKTILTEFFGFREAADGELIAPQGDPNIMAKIEIIFSGGVDKATCWQVKLANNVVLESLRTDIARGRLTGTLMTVDLDQLLPTPTGTPDLRAFSFGTVTP